MKYYINITISVYFFFLKKKDFRKDKISQFWKKKNKLARAKMIKSSKVELKRDGIVDERERGVWRRGIFVGRVPIREAIEVVPNTEGGVKKLPRVIRRIGRPSVIKLYIDYIFRLPGQKH